MNYLREDKKNMFKAHRRVTSYLALSLLILNSLGVKADPLNQVSKSGSNFQSTSANHIPVSKLIASNLKSRQMLAQSPSMPLATPIPPAASGSVDLEEFKTGNVIDIKVDQSRAFKLKNPIIRVSLSDPSIADVVVVAENQIVIIGKTAGAASLVLWDDAGNAAAIDMMVTRDYSQLQSTLREIDPRIIVKSYNVQGVDKVLLLGDVDYVETVIKAYQAACTYMDDIGWNIVAASNRVVDRSSMNAMIGEMGMGASMAGGAMGQLSSLGSADRYTYFSNLTNSISRAQVLRSNGGRVVSLVKVRKVPLIVLHCTFMEVNSQAIRELSTQLGFNYSSNTFAFGVGGNTSGQISGSPMAPPGYVYSFPQMQGLATNPYGIGGTQLGNFVSNLAYGASGASGITGIGLGVLNGPPPLLGSSVLFGAPGGAAFNGGGLLNTFYSQGIFPYSARSRASINPVFNGVIAQNRARILAEPTLVTVSGERAAFLAGGEIPVQQAGAGAGVASASIVFVPFGLRLNMIPVLKEDGGINIEIAPEERILDQSLGLVLAGSISTIPGFTTRKTQTMVELKPGQELYISGLVTANSGRQLTKTPVLGEVPVLGALYKSKAFSKNESELIVAIRPEIILPGTPGQLKLPEEIGRVEGPRDMNMFQVEPTVIDERYYTSGRDERTQPTSPTLPAGAPIPDNN